MDAKRNIPLLIIIQSIRWFLLIMPTIVVFFQNNGLSLFQVMFVQAVFSFTMAVFEIPSGYFSDMIGRKITMIIGLFFSMTGMFLFTIAPNFIGFIIAELALGIGASFVSGTDTSLLYDTLISLKDEKRHHKIEGFYMSIGNYSESAASILGGFIAAYSMRLNFQIKGILLIGAIFMALFLVEPKMKREGKGALTIKHFWKELNHIVHQKNVLYLVVFCAFSGLGTFLALWYVQPELSNRGFPLAYFGIVWAGLNVLVGICSAFSHKLPMNKDPLRSLAMIPFLFSLFYFLLMFIPGYWIILGFVGFYIIRGLKNPFERNLIHRSVSSQNRATVISLQSLTMRLSFTLLGPLFALLSNENNNQYVYGAIGLFFLLLAVLNLFVKKRVSLPLNGKRARQDQTLF